MEDVSKNCNRDKGTREKKKMTSKEKKRELGALEALVFGVVVVVAGPEGAEVWTGADDAMGRAVNELIHKRKRCSRRRMTMR